MKKFERKHFTDRQAQVIELVLMGKETIEIADRLKVSKRTIEAHIATMMAKFCMPNRVALCFYYLLTHDEISSGLIDSFIREHPYSFTFLNHDHINHISGYNGCVKRTED